MKKGIKTIISVLVFCMILTILISGVKAETLEGKFGFEKVFSIHGGHTLEYYKVKHKDQIEQALIRTRKKKAFGSNIEWLNDGSNIFFRKQTVLQYYNDGATPIDYELVEKKETIKKFQFGMSGSNSANLAVNHKSGFKGDINKKLGIDLKTSVETSVRSEFKNKTVIGPGEKMTIDVVGNGVVYSGCATRYVFWVQSDSGTFEYCKVNSLYNRMIKERIRL